jgi:hypothetical protein
LVLELAVEWVQEWRLLVQVLTQEWVQEYPELVLELTQEWHWLVWVLAQDLTPLVLVWAQVLVPVWDLEIYFALSQVKQQLLL